MAIDREDWEGKLLFYIRGLLLRSDSLAQTRNKGKKGVLIPPTQLRRRKEMKERMLIPLTG